MEVLSELAAVLCADFDGTISETTVSVSLFCRDSSREPTQCDHSIKTPLSLHLNLLLFICRSQAHTRGSWAWVADILWGRACWFGLGSFRESLAGNLPAASGFRSVSLGAVPIFWKTLLRPTGLLSPRHGIQSSLSAFSRGGWRVAVSDALWLPWVTCQKK